MLRRSGPPVRDARPEANPFDAAGVVYDGGLYSNYVDEDRNVVRPALWVDPESGSL